MISFSINTSDATLLLYDGARRAFDFSRDARFLLYPGQKKGLSLRRNLCWKQNDPEIRVYRSAVSSSSCSFKHVVVAARLVLKLSNYSENIRIKEHTHTHTHTRGRATMLSFSFSTWLDHYYRSAVRSTRLSNSLLIVTLPVTLITRSTMNWRRVSNDTNIWRVRMFAGRSDKRSKTLRRTLGTPSW